MSKKWTITKNPFPLNVIVADSSLRKDLEVEFRAFKRGIGEEGGITLWAHEDERNPDRPRALVFWGPLPVDAEEMLRPLVEKHFKLSHVRSTKVSHKTATLDDPFGY